jgi:hypothetical protein
VTNLKLIQLKILDKIIIAVLIVASILPAGIVILSGFNKQNNNIVIKVDNKVVKQVPLTKVNSSKTYDFKFKNNTGYIEVKDGKVRMLLMDKKICPNSICSDTGWISKSYQTIVCLPNSIIVTLEKSQNEGIDTESF